MKNLLLLMVAVFATVLQVHAQDLDEDLFDLSLEELMNIEIVSASKKAESSFKSPLSMPGMHSILLLLRWDLQTKLVGCISLVSIFHFSV